MNAKYRGAVISALVLLAACAPPKPPSLTVEELRGDRAKTREMLKLCREHPDRVSSETCNAAGIAAHDQFMGSGITKYTPGGEPLKSPAGKE